MAAREEAAALAAYLPRLALSWDREHPDASWRAIDGSLVLVDISGFTALSERLAGRGRVGAEELTDVLGSCFARLLAEAYARGGALLKFGGDALLLLFDGVDHAARACDAALAMRATMRTVGRLTTSVGTVRLRMSVGVHSGELHVFRVGNSHKELVVTGPGASTTVDMESTAEAGEILVSPATAAAVHRRLVGRAKGAGFLLRNVAVPIGAQAYPPAPEARGDVARSIPVALRAHLRASGVESEHRHATVAFIHFDGTDELLEREGACAVAAALDEVVREAQAAVEEHGVTFLATDIDRDGGKIILVGAAPSALGDDEGRVLRAVRRIADHRGRLPLRIGVNHGPVFAGEVGPPYRRTYTVMGDAVNLAARLMARAEPGEIIATAGVLDRSRTAFDTDPLPPFMVKGKSAPIEAFRVGALGESRALQQSAALPFTGRDAELTQLSGALDAARGGQGALYEIVGDAGVGKSRLLHELRARLDRTALFEVACEPYEATTPYFVFRNVLRGLLRLPEGDAAGAALQARVCEVAPHLAPWFPLVADVVGIEVPPTLETRELEPRFRRQRTNLAVADLLQATFRDPALVLVEDAQWMDDASAGTLETLAARLDDVPWLICVARRDEGSGFQAPRLDTVVPLQLGPITSDAAQALVASVPMDPPLRPEEREAIVRQAGGNPLFLEELLTRRAATGDAALPESLEAVVASQIDRLPPADRRLLRYAAVLGASFDPELLAQIVDDDLTTTATGAARRLRGFVERSGDRLRFRNRVLRDVAYETLPFGRRRALHARAGDAIERGAGDRADERAEILSLHFLHAQDHDRCFHYARMAAERARDRYANVEAAELYERALTASRHVGTLPPGDLALLWEHHGDVQGLLGRYEAARVSYRRARGLHPDDPASAARLYWQESRMADRAHQAVSALRLLRRALRLVEGRDDDEAVALRAELLAQYAWNRQQSGRHHEAVKSCERVLAEATGTGALRSLAQAYMVLDWAYMDLGRPDLATNADKALAIWEELGDLLSQAWVLNTKGAFAYYEGDWDGALELYRRGRDANLRAGNLVDAAFGTCNIAEVLIDQGRDDEAEPLLHEVSELWRSVGYRAAVGFALRHLGRIAVRRDDHEEALRLLQDARATFEVQGLGAKVLEVDAWLAECHLRRGEIDEAVALLDDAVAREEATGGSVFRSMLLRLRAYAHAARQDLVDAWADLDAALAVARSRNAAFDTALALEALSVIASLDGRAYDPATDEERMTLLERLGVKTTPRPPLGDRGVLARS